MNGPPEAESITEDMIATSKKMDAIDQHWDYVDGLLKKIEHYEAVVHNLVAIIEIKDEHRATKDEHQEFV